MLCVYANNQRADQPAHPTSLISVFVVDCQDSNELSLNSKSHHSLADQAWLETWPRGYKTFFMLNSTELENLTAH